MVPLNLLIFYGTNISMIPYSEQLKWHNLHNGAFQFIFFYGTNSTWCHKLSK